MGSAGWTKVFFERQQCCSSHAYDAMQSLWSPSIADTFGQNPPPMGIPTFACGLGYRTFRRKMPPCSLSPLERGSVPLNVGFLCKAGVGQEWRLYVRPSEKYTAR